MNPDFPPSLLTALFDGTATPLQTKLIRDWLRENKANAEIFFEQLEAYEAQSPHYRADPEVGYQRFRTLLAVPAEAPAAPLRLVRRFAGAGWWLAASVALLLLVGFWQREWLLFRQYQTGFGQTTALTLADGSRVTLNANSTLRVPRFGFGDRTREVTLTGEAEFSVTHTPTHQRFVVRTPRALDVVVLGTEFTVLARPRATRVVLNRGRVQVQFHEGNQPVRQLTMRPGDLVTLKTNGRLALRRIAQPSQFSAWKDHQFVFDQTPLSEVADLLADHFGIRVVIPDPALARLSITGSFTARTADELLDSVAEALDLRVKRTDAQTFLLE